ncbi:hypothetical protein BKP45_15325 [Anaerobacillus alkalidiazotrophicus]|uniref:Uncharacterized protein n=1 Tax=Anaerobacillus alkalidiazotrophicus TaxID=472963 RepID=A0A1S2M2T3_9BACI|nr:hypothetical protein [Anaerobacillus alkalidiazotrophicus]OIJ18896.1 hypothetical protein BKP45_15325 [Anaerobacillus alkalidiazotrophicus]
MTIEFILIILYTMIVFWLFSFIFVFRNKISCMAGMMIAMIVGMVLGLSAGMFLAMFYPDHFFEITVVSILIGAITGTIAGFPISIMAVLDGFLSGAMGGMMGAMLGIMVSQETINQTLNVIVVISGGVLFILFLMIQSEINIKEKGWKNFFFVKRLPLFLVIILAFYFTHLFSYSEKHEEIDHSIHSNSHWEE